MTSIHLQLGNFDDDCFLEFNDLTSSEVGVLAQLLSKATVGNIRYVSDTTGDNRQACILREEYKKLNYGSLVDKHSLVFESVPEFRTYKAAQKEKRIAEEAKKLAETESEEKPDAA